MPLVLAQPSPIPGLSQLTAEAARRQEIRPLRIRLIDADGSGGELLAAFLAQLSDTPLQVEAILRADDRPLDGVIAWGEYPGGPELPAGIPALLLGECARQTLVERHGAVVEDLTRPLIEIAPHRLVPHPLLTGQEPVVTIPVARSWRISLESLANRPGLEILAYAPRLGVHLAWEAASRRLFVLNQIGWSPLGYTRSRRRLAGGEAAHHATLPAHAWRAHGHLLLRAWLNLAVYQPLSLPPLLPD
jgi:homoserine trans-succinylase